MTQAIIISFPESAGPDYDMFKQYRDVFIRSQMDQFPYTCTC